MVLNWLSFGYQQGLGTPHDHLRGTVRAGGTDVEMDEGQIGEAGVL